MARGTRRAPSSRMAVATTQTIVQYQGNGSTVSAYPVPFPFHDEEWLRVQVLSEAGGVTELELGTGFAATGAGSPDGGEIVTVDAWDDTHVVTIFREVPITQLLALLYNDRLPAALVERSLDKITFILQQLAGNAATGDRSLRFPFSEPAGNTTTLPVPVTRRDTVVYFDQVTGELVVLPLDQLAQRLLVILGAEAILPYRTREVTESFAITQEDVNSSIRVNSVADAVVTLPATDDFSDNFFAAIARFSSGAVQFIAPGGVIIESEVGSAPRIFGAKKPVGIQIIGENRWWVFGDIY